MIIDTSHRDDFVNINIDITFPRMPCDILSLDEQDVLGTHKTDMMENLQKHRLDSNGRRVSTESQMDKNQFRGNIFERTKKELDEKQGCQMVGYVRAYRVPGNVHIASHPYMDIVNGLKAKDYQFDFSHRIDHVSFGNKQDFDYISKGFGDL